MTVQPPHAPVRPRPGPRPGLGSWPGRPAGIPAVVPPPSVPLSFLAAAAAGLVAAGGALVWARAAAVADPAAERVVAAAHFGLLATLSTGVLGALHQFTPVVTQRPLRSVRLARATFFAWLAAAWLLPSGFAAQQEGVVEAGGVFAALAVGLLVANLSAPLAARGKGTTVTGLRFALAGFVATACFGLVYVADRRANWFNLPGHTVLAHAVIGLFAWLGLTYVSVAEKLWPMFFLAHVPGRRRSGQVAVWAVAGGVALLSPGLLVGAAWLAWPGAVMLAAGLGAHLASLLSHVGHRRRKADLHLVFVVTSALWLLAGAGLALAATVVMPRDHHAGVALAAAAVTAFAGWLLGALVGHAHKVVPFIMWSVLRGRGISATAAGRPLGFADLYDHRAAWAVYALVNAGIAAVSAGFGGSAPVAIAVGGALLTAAGLAAAASLSVPPTLLLRHARTPEVRAAEPHPPAAAPVPARPAAPVPARADPSLAPGFDPSLAPGFDASLPPRVDAPPPARPARSAAQVTGPGAPPRPGSGVTLSLVAIAAAAVALIMAAAALWPGRPGGTGQAAAPVANARVVPNGQTKAFAVELGDMFVRPSSISVRYGTRVVLHVVNRGAMGHNLQLEGGSVGTGMLGPGQRKTVGYGVFGHTEHAWCTVPGHKASGMILTIKVTGAAPRAPRTAAGSSVRHGGHQLQRHATGGMAAVQSRGVPSARRPGPPRHTGRRGQADAGCSRRDSAHVDLQRPGPRAHPARPRR